MKAKTMLGLIACASACVSLSAFGNETNGWFGVKVENAEIVHPNCATNGAAVTIDGSAIKLEDASLGIDNFAAAPTSDDIVKISATALLTPSSTSDFDVSGSPKAGFAVGVDNLNATNFYGYASNSWHKLTGATPGAGETSFSMILNYRDKVVSFYVDDVLLTSEDPLILDANSLASISASGSGSITSVTGAYEVAVAAYGGKKYGSGAEAVKAKGDGEGDILDVASDGTTTTTPQAANGLYAWECDALGVAKDAKIPFKPAATVNGKITLQIASEIEDGLAATFKVYPVGSETEIGSYPSDAIQIPQEQGAYLVKPDQITAK